MRSAWKTLQLVSLPPFQFALISWMKRPVFDVFDCSFVPDCFLLQFSLFLCCSIRRSPADFLERRRGQGARSPTPGQLRPGQVAHVGKLQHPSPSPAAREAGSFSLSLSRSNRSCFPLVVMLQNRLGTRTKTSQTRVFCVVALYLPLYQAVTFPKMIYLISLRFRFDRPFERPFRSQFSELAPRPQHSVQKIPSNGMQNLQKSSERDWTFGEGRFCVQLCIETLCKRATLVAFLTNFFMKFLQKMPLNVFYTMVEKVKNDHNSNQGCPALNLHDSKKRMNSKHTW